MKKVIIFTSSDLRHKALVKIMKESNKLFVSDVFYEKGNALETLVEQKEINFLQKNHLNSRNKVEEEVFGKFLNKKNNIDGTIVERFWFSSEECLSIVNKAAPDLILVYGTSIIKGRIIKNFKNKILNLHLGLSPYYRGSGTNYFPFVNNEPEYVGATYMFLDEGIDTGVIIHQIRPNILKDDSFHILSNRFLLKAFKTYVLLVENFEKVKMKNKFVNNANKVRKFFKRSDFTERSLKKLHKNFKDGMINKYLDNKSLRDSLVPLIKQESFKEI